MLASPKFFLKIKKLNTRFAVHHKRARSWLALSRDRCFKYQMSRSFIPSEFEHGQLYAYFSTCLLTTSCSCFTVLSPLPLA